MDPSSTALREAASLSVDQMRRREQAHGAVPMSDYLGTAPVWHTINHPDNATLEELARRVAATIVGAQVELSAPVYEMLGDTKAPIDPAAADALGVRVNGRNQWTVRGKPIGAAEIVDKQMEFYRARPGLVAAGLARHAERLSVLGLMV